MNAEFTFLNYTRSLHYDVDELQKVCLCCLEKDVTFVNLTTCKHFGILEKLCSIPKIELGCLVCYHCHAKLKSIHEFKLQTEESFHLLRSQNYSGTKKGLPQTKGAPKLQGVLLINNEINYQYQPEGLLSDWIEIKPELNQVKDDHEIVSGYWLSKQHCPPVTGPQLNQKNKVPPNKIKTECGKVSKEARLAKNSRSRVSKISSKDTNYEIELSELNANSPLDHGALSDLDTDDIPLSAIKSEVEIEAPKLWKNEISGTGRKQLPQTNHKETVVSEKELFPCTECDKDYSDKKALRRHNLTMHNYQKRCTPKRYTFEDFAEIINLITLTHEELMVEREMERKSDIYLQRLHRCDLCIVSYNHKQLLKDHNAKRHRMTENSFRCDICKSVFAAHYNMKAHEKKHYTRYECTVCQKRYSSLTSMVDHINKLHDSKNKVMFQCTLCDYTATSHRSFAYHLEKHKGRNDCKACSSSFITKASLKMHMLSVHGKTKDRPKFRCEECNKTYSSRYYLTVHNKAKHTPSLPAATDVTDIATYFYCDTCKIFFINDRALQNHLKFHKNHQSEDDKRYICDICNKRFFSKGNIRDHITFLHLKMKQFSCPQCPKICGNRSILNKHIRYVHEKIRPPRNKICDYCGMGFQTVGILRSHIRRHTGERPYQCAHCPSTFAHSGALYTHNKLLHSQQRKRKC